MPWPNELLTTYTPNSPVKSNDLMLIQQAIIGEKHGEHLIWGVPCVPSSSLAVYSNSDVDGNERFDLAADDLVAFYFPELLPGTNVNRMLIRANTTPSKNLTPKVWMRSGVAAAVQMSAGVDHYNINGDVISSLAQMSPFQVSANGRVYVTAYCLIDPVKLYGIGLYVDRL